MSNFGIPLWARFSVGHVCPVSYFGVGFVTSTNTKQVAAIIVTFLKKIKFQIVFILGRPCMSHQLFWHGCVTLTNANQLAAVMLFFQIIFQKVRKSVSLPPPPPFVPALRFFCFGLLSSQSIHALACCLRLSPSLSASLSLLFFYTRACVCVCVCV